MRVILVTGATGCLGSNLTRALVERGEEVAVFRRPDDPVTTLGDAAGRVQHRLGDVRDPAAVEGAFRGVRRVYHLAGIAVLANVLHEEMVAVNVEGTRTVARAALAAGVERLVHVSSSAAVGWPDGEPADESFPFNGFEFGHSYMITKWRGERAVLGLVEEGLEAVVVNPTGVLAPLGSRTHGWAGLVDAIMRGRLPLCPPGGLGMTTGRDLISALLAAMDRGTPGERYIVNTRNLSYRELFALIEQTAGGRAPAAVAPGPVLSVLGWMGSGWVRLGPGRRSPPIVLRENLPMLTRRLFYDQSKAVRELALSQTPLEAAVQEVAEWCAAGGPGEG